MRTAHLFSLASLAVALAACQRPAPPRPAALPPADAAQLRAIAAGRDGAEIVDMLFATTATNRAGVFAEFQSALVDSTIEALSQQSATELNRKLGTLKLGTNRHPYTREQLEEALRRREERARQKKSEIECERMAVEWDREASRAQVEFWRDPANWSK